MEDFTGLSEAVDRALGMGANQRRPELLIAGTVLRLEPPRSVLEIGNAFGGTLYFWSQVATHDAKVAGVDIDHSQLSDQFRVREGQQLLLHESRSDDPSALAEVSRFFGGPIDFLFIDGDHGPMVRTDFETYSPLVRPGGWIGFHDILPMGDVVEFWNELRPQYKQHLEIQIEPIHHMAIGLLRVE